VTLRADFLAVTVDTVA
jgi:hypothetical protein